MSETSVQRRIHMEEKRWNLNPIYPGVDSKEFNDDLAKLKKCIKM